jgi:hypothetical protein
MVTSMIIGSSLRASLWRAAVAASALTLVSFMGQAAHAALGGSPGAPFTHQVFNGVFGPITQNGDGTIGESTFKNPPSPICTLATSAAANVNTDCEATAPHNETSIAVNPTNTLNLIGGANDYQLRLSSGGKINETVLTRAHVSFDGGKSWAMYPIPFSSYTATGDPAAAFDASGNAYMATLGFGFSQGRSPTVTNPDVLVAHSANSGKTWNTVRVATGSGVETSQGILNDKEYIAAWGNGNVIVTWTRFQLGMGGSVIRSPIFDAVSHDGGNTWTAPQEISGSAPFCLGAPASNPTTCDQDQFSTPVVAADGSIYVSFESTDNLDPASLSFGADQYLVVKVDPATGARVAGPFLVSKLVDGVYDYPVDASGRQTYQDSQFRTNSAGSIAADPTNAAHLAVVWSDMRNSSLPGSPAAFNPDPYSVTTNSDIVVSQSFNGGQTWSAPAAIARPGDQFMPWAAYDGSGLLHIGFFDRSYDAANHKYGYTLAAEAAQGTLSFALQQVTTELSDPTQGDRWFSGLTVNSSFPHPSSFIGDYSGIAAAPGGSMLGYWTDMRQAVCFTTRCGSGEDAYFAGS